MSTQKGKLVYNSATAESTTGTRSGFQVDRFLLFETPEVTVDLAIHGGTGRLGFLHGQLIERETEGSLVRASVSLGRAEGFAYTDEHGQFIIGCHEREGAHTLVIQAGDEEIVCEVPSVDVE